MNSHATAPAPLAPKTRIGAPSLDRANIAYVKKFAFQLEIVPLVAISAPVFHVMVGVPMLADKDTQGAAFISALAFA